MRSKARNSWNFGDRRSQGVAVGSVWLPARDARAAAARRPAREHDRRRRRAASAARQDRARYRAAAGSAVLSILRRSAVAHRRVTRRRGAAAARLRVRLRGQRARRAGRHDHRVGGRDARRGCPRRRARADDRARGPRSELASRAGVARRARVPPAVRDPVRYAVDDRGRRRTDRSRPRARRDSSRRTSCSPAWRGRRSIHRVARRRLFAVVRLSRTVRARRQRAAFVGAVPAQPAVPFHTLRRARA